MCTVIEMKKWRGTIAVSRAKWSGAGRTTPLGVGEFEQIGKIAARVVAGIDRR